MIIKLNGAPAKLPDFFYAGVSRSGSTSLYYALKQHPRIYLSPEKEPFFFNGRCFNNHNVHESAISTIEDYVRLFSGAHDEIIGEATTTYLYSHESTIANIKKIYGNRYKDLKIILMLRNPVERAFSQYKLFVRDAREPLDFEEAIKADVMEKRREEHMGYDYIGHGMYYNQVKAFIDNFPNVRVFIYEDFKADNMRTIKEIFRFLKVDDSFIPEMEIRYNVSGKVRIQWLYDYVFFKRSFLKDLFKPFIPHELEMRIRYRFIEKNMRKWDMSPDTKKILLSIYEDDICKLQDLLKRDLSFWLNSQ
jgi:hypothetical protein